MNIDLVEKALPYIREGKSWRKTAELLGVPRSTLSDSLREYFKREVIVKKHGDKQATLPSSTAPSFSHKPFIQTTASRGSGPHKHLVIPDTQMKPGVSTEYLRWAGEYIVDKRPDVIIHLGDHADMPSLSSYDKGKRSSEGRRVQADLEAAKEGMVALLSPLRRLQEEQEEMGLPVYRPRLILTLGNHEERIMRHVNANPELHGFLNYDSLGYKEFGWEVYDYLTPVVVDGVSYIHFMPNPMTGKPFSGTAANTLKTVGESFTQGHKQTLDVHTRFLPFSGKQQWAIVAGAYYDHDEDYKGVTGNKHWRGVILKHDVKDGSFDPCFVSIDYLRTRYGQGS